MSDNDRETLLSVARMTLQTFVKTRRLPDIELSSSGVRQRAGVYVTLTTLGRLRGSVGALEETQPLYRAVMEDTALAAERDAEIPIGAHELHHVRIRIDVVTGLGLLPSPDEIEIGSTGLAIRSDPAIVILPKIAANSGWRPEQFIEAICSEAGLPANAWRLGAPVYRFAVDSFAEED
ncbi:MAG TPA: AMMECR1 domain-containing protein [Armatimonadota bacterium]|nr:AMMECR1 domain-containing protein [Armatimonadota bacterium]